MTDNIPEKYQDLEKYTVLKSGAIYGKEEGHIVANPGGGKYAITPERGLELNRLQHEKRQRHAVIGDIRGFGIEIASDAPDDEIEQKRLQAIEVHHEKWSSLYMKATSARGVEGIDAKVDSSLMGTSGALPPALEQSASNVYVLIAQYIAETLGRDKAATVDGEVTGE
jgi:hypothetical protein